MNTEEMLSYFQSNLGGLTDKDRKYEKFLSHFAYQNNDKVDLFEQIMHSESEFAYEAFFCLATIHRHNRDYQMLNSLITEAESIDSFKDRISLSHIRTMYEIHSESLYDYDKLLKEAHFAACLLYDNSGYQHTFANAFATICEQCAPEDLSGIVDVWYDSALYCVNRAIELEPGYAKFYCTKARIVALRHLYEAAGELILKAIDLEDSKKADYALLLGNYQYYRIMISMNKHQWLINSQLQGMKPDAKEKKQVRAEGVSFDPTRSYAFISYSHSDSDVLDKVLNGLDSKAIAFWYDGFLTAGDDWTEEIGKRLLNCEKMVLLLSNRAILSKNVRNEITMAQNHQIEIVPVFIGDVELSPGAELQLQQYHRLYYSDNTVESLISKLSSALGNCQSANKSVTKSLSAQPQMLSDKADVVSGLQILDSLCESKTGNNQDCQDILVISDDYIAVIDGVTSKTPVLFNGKTGGRLAAEFISNFLLGNNLDPLVDGRTAINRIQNAMKEFARSNNLDNQGIHLCASAVIYSVSRRQIWTVGDCQFVLNGTHYSFPKKVDTILSEARALAMHMLLASGMTEEELMKNDQARTLILDELRMQHFLENSDDEYGYSVFSSKGQVQSFTITDVPEGSEVILASDGYPELLPTLAQSEARLNEILRSDPLCYKVYKSTKGLVAGSTHFDDRTYVRFKA